MQILIIIGVLLIARSQCFLKLPFKDKIQYHDVIDIEISNEHRPRRSTDNLNHIETYDLDFEVERSNVKLHLVRNDKIDTNVPIYTMKHGSTKKYNGREKEDSIFYQDVKNDASFVVQTDLQGKQSMFGTFSFAGEEYIMQTSPQRNNTFDGRYKNVQLIKERKRNVQFDDVFKIGDSFKHQTKYHRRKRATGSHQIELLIICDYAIYSYWYAKSDKSTIQEKETDALTTVRQYYAFVLNGMDAMYKNIQTSSYTISVLFTGIIISQTPGDAPWTENIKDTSFTPNRVDSTVALGNFQAWVKLQTGLPDHDHAMLFTRYDLTASGLTGNAGLAFTSAVCSENSQSIVEEAFDFVVITTAAHELGHCLSASHDGSGNLCSPSDAYIMAASSMPQQGATAAHPWIFSSCSTEYFTSYIDQLDSANNNCMKTLSTSFDPTAQSPYDQFLAGQVYNADSQCVQLHGDGSYLCREQYNGDFSTICNILWCYKPDISQCQSSIAGEGTHCGNQKWCVSGVCTQDVKAPIGNENCLYGDRKGIIFSNLGWTCADAYANNPSLCSSQPIVSLFCCGSCFPETTTVSLSTQNYVTSTVHVTTMDSDTTTSLKTTIKPETTSETKITTMETSKQPKTTTSVIHTTKADTTTPQLITTKTFTTLNVATTPKSSTEHDETTTATSTTTKTDFVTTTDSITTIAGLTTTHEKTSVLTTNRVKTTTAVPTTTAQKVGTTKAVTTTGELTPTQKATLVSTDKTQQPDTSSVNVTDVVDNTNGIIDPVVIGVGIAVFGLTILGIVIVCLTVYYRRRGKHSKNQSRSTNDFKKSVEPDYYSYNNPSTPVMAYDTMSGRWHQRVLHREHYSLHDTYNNPSTISKGGIRPVWNAQYHYQDADSNMDAYNYVNFY
ncbi:uncharacterized protein LOC127718000 [Mytilus californianus]|uniref:uncharacterized protein LOC127718000 n=1 Tax=Mytilus californianus TaxID=6549 RepID=UPI0022478D82|nr:uncharacterized protein LOC127718000 [Mytilus californianus]